MFSLNNSFKVSKINVSSEEYILHFQSNCFHKPLPLLLSHFKEMKMQLASDQLRGKLGRQQF